jgi:hypothetical protein
VEKLGSAVNTGLLINIVDVVFLNGGGFVYEKVRFPKMDENLDCSYLKKDELLIFPQNL